tara:strand:- start:3768 stop:4295 length:528 start_codon:yes stop_codon:yes gene_type:complete
MSDELFNWAESKSAIKTVSLESMRGIVLDSKIPCQCCGVIAALNPHRIDKQKTRVIRDIAILQLDNQWIRVESGRGLRGDMGEWKATAYQAGAHITRAGWFGLAESMPRSADWRITSLGFDFLRGIADIPLRILCRGGIVIYESIERIRITDVTETFDKDYWDSYPWSELESASP